MIKNHLKNTTQLSIIVHRGKAERRTTCIIKKRNRKTRSTKVNKASFGNKTCQNNRT